MKVRYLDAATALGVAPLQVLVELAAMNQPHEDCWPECDEGFIQTLRERRRLRMGFPAIAPSRPVDEGGSQPDQRLPLSESAAAILDKLVRKSYGLKSVRVNTLVQKWMHAPSDEGIRELVQEGFLEWSDGDRSRVNLVGSMLAETERIVELYRKRVRSQR